MVTIPKSWTVKEFERASLDGLWELIDGELVEVSPAGRKSSNVTARFCAVIATFVVANRLGEVYSAEGGFVLFPDRQTVRAPDVSFVRADRLTDQDEVGFLRLAPDLAVEVRSPTDRRGERESKIRMYEEAGVPLIWDVDPARPAVRVHRQGVPSVTLGEHDVLDGDPVLPGFRTTLADILR